METGALRGFFDGSEPFMTDGHQIKNRAGATQHVSRLRRIPVWTRDDQKIREILLHSFPTLETNQTQRERAARWLRIIHLYYRMGWTRGQIAGELQLSDSQIHDCLIYINRAARGKTARKKERSNRPRGRPRKVVYPLEEIVHL